MKRALLVLLIILTSLALAYVILSSLPHGRKQETSKDVNYHYSYFSNKAFYDNAFSRAKKPLEEAPKYIAGLTMNHHLLAPEIMAGTIMTVATTSPLTVVVISPNHNALGKDEVLTSDYDWQTPYGTLLHNADLVQSLAVSKLASIDEKPFETEHGINALVAFIKRALPNAKIVPLIIKDGTSIEKSKQLARVLNSILPDSSLVIASLDFSHYLPNYVSDFHDQKSVDVFRSFDIEATQALDIDSKPSAYTFLTYLELRKAKKAALLFHTNANEITGNLGSFDNTSYINMAYGKGQGTTTQDVTMLAFGDMMLDRYARYQMNKYGFLYPFKNILRFLDGSDIVLANLEGPITDYSSITADLKSKKLQFTFDPHVVPTLKEIGFTTFGLANNHTANFGASGITQTKKYLTNASLDYYGDPFNKEDISYVKDIRGKKIAFIGYHEFYSKDTAPIIKEIKRLKGEADFIIVTPHWGVEYRKLMANGQIAKAHEFIDAGADLVLGAHPHVIEPIEIYKNKAIFYSLGNFVFDQDPGFDTTHGLSVGIIISPEEISYSLFPINIIKAQVSLADEAARAKILKELSENSIVPQSVKDGIIKGKFNIKTHE